MSEEIRRGLQARQHEIEKQYERLRGMVQGTRSMVQGDVVKAVLGLLELLLIAKKSSLEDNFAVLDVQVDLQDRITSLETITNELKQDINQLRKTLDTLGEMR